MNGSQAVFIDKDGTLIWNRPYNVDPQKIRFMPGVAESLMLMKALGFKLVVVSNQAGVARGHFEETALSGVNERLHLLFNLAGAPLDGFYYCPHHPDATRSEYRIACGCRKPGAGMFVRAAEDLGIYLPGSWMIGDILDDVEAGRAAGCRTILLDNGHETEWAWGPMRTPHYTVGSFAEASRIIVREASLAKAGLNA